MRQSRTSGSVGDVVGNGHVYPTSNSQATALLWFVPILAVATIGISFVTDNRPVGVVAGIVPVSGFLYLIAQFLENVPHRAYQHLPDLLSRVLDIGAYLTLIAGVALICAGLLAPRQKFVADRAALGQAARDRGRMPRKYECPACGRRHPDDAVGELCQCGLRIKENARNPECCSGPEGDASTTGGTSSHKCPACGRERRGRQLGELCECGLRIKRSR